MAPERISLHFGALCDPIVKQLEVQGVVLNDNGLFQDLADSIVSLHLHGVITDSVVEKSRQKLMKQISDHIHKKQETRP